MINTKKVKIYLKQEEVITGFSLAFNYKISGTFKSRRKKRGFSECSRYSRKIVKSIDYKIKIVVVCLIKPEKRNSYNFTFANGGWTSKKNSPLR